LKSLEHPAIQVATSAATGFSIAILLSAVVTGRVKPKDEAAQKLGFSTSLIGLGCGTVLDSVPAKGESSSFSKDH
jgi:hypothetical protein